MRPLIGISAEIAPVPRYWGTDEHHVVETGYVTAVTAAAALAVVLPLGDPADVAAVCRRLDGLVISGGVDVHPATYGATPVPVPTGGEPDPRRDRYELALARQAIDTDLPTLAICRGMQIVNVACGGTLVQHLDDHPETPAGPLAVSHTIAVDPTSRLAARHPDLRHVNSYHHQAVERPGDGVRVVATAPDGVVEAIEVDGAPRLVAVQWHPETLIERPEHLALFRWLAAAAAGGTVDASPATPARAR